MATEQSAVIQKSEPCCDAQEFRVRSLEQERVHALARLIALLSPSTAEVLSRPPLQPEDGRNAWGRLARLRAAHASYTLASGAMQRVHAGAWMRRHEH